MAKKKNINIVIVAGVVLMLVLVVMFALVQMNAPTYVPKGQYDVREDLTLVKGQNGSFKVPKGLQVTESGSSVYAIRKPGLFALDTAPLIVDLSLTLNYADTLKTAKASLKDPKVSDAFYAGLLGQEVQGIYLGKGSREGKMVIGTYLHDNGKAIRIELTEYDAQGQEYRDVYQTIRKTLQLSSPVAGTVGQNFEYVPPYVRDGIKATHTFVDGTHTISGEIMMPNPCYALTADVVVTPKKDFAAIYLVGLEPGNVICAEVITKKTFSVQFAAAKNTDIQAFYNKLPVHLVYQEK